MLQSVSGGGSAIGFSSFAFGDDVVGFTSSGVKRIRSPVLDAQTQL
nr:MAG TPA: hypothetical protein [Caudoviricetes sp.]